VGVASVVVLALTGQVARLVVDRYRPSFSCLCLKAQLLAVLSYLSHLNRYRPNLPPLVTLNPRQQRPLQSLNQPPCLLRPVLL
jgi:hypothetical protein